MDSCLTRHLAEKFRGLEKKIGCHERLTELPRLRNAEEGVSSCVRGIEIIRDLSLIQRDQICISTV